MGEPVRQFCSDSETLLREVITRTSGATEVPAQAHYRLVAIKANRRAFRYGPLTGRAARRGVQLDARCEFSTKFTYSSVCRSLRGMLSCHERRRPKPWLLGGREAPEGDLWLAIFAVANLAGRGWGENIEHRCNACVVQLDMRRASSLFGLPALLTLFLFAKVAHKEPCNVGRRLLAPRDSNLRRFAPQPPASLIAASTISATSTDPSTALAITGRINMPVGSSVLAQISIGGNRAVECRRFGSSISLSPFPGPLRRPP